jgi:hypothetical protein
VLRWVEKYNTDTDDGEYSRDREIALKRRIVEYMNRFFVKVSHNTGAPTYMEEYRGEEMHADSTEIVEATCFTARGKQHMMTAFEQFTFEIAGPKKSTFTSAIDIWRTSPLSRCVRRIDFDPREGASALSANGNIFNLFRGLSITRDTPGDASKAQPITDHIHKIWCNDDLKCSEYLLNWMAHLVQHPARKMVVCPVLKGGQGAGKGIIIQLLGKILGAEHFLQTTNLESITGRFQEDRIKTNLLTFLDECTFANDKKQSSILKGLLSESTRRWEAKYLNSLRLKNFSNHIVASNYDQIVFVEESDRRWFCLEVDSRYAGKQTNDTKAYFKPILAVTPADFGKFLYERDLTRFNPREMPTSSYQLHQKRINFDSVSTFIEQFLQDGSRDYKKQDADGDYYDTSFDLVLNCNTIEKDLFYSFYEVFCTETSMRFKYAVARPQFWKKINEVVGVTQTRPCGKRMVQFSNLAKCRKNFTSYLKEPAWPWEDDIIDHESEERFTTARRTRRAQQHLKPKPQETKDVSEDVEPMPTTAALMCENCISGRPADKKYCPATDGMHLVCEQCFLKRYKCPLCPSARIGLSHHRPVLN